MGEEKELGIGSLSYLQGKEGGECKIEGGAIIPMTPGKSVEFGGGKKHIITKLNDQFDKNKTMAT